MTENPYLRKWKQPRKHSKSFNEIIDRISNLTQRLGNEQEMLIFWRPLIGKTLEEMSKIDRFIINSEPLIKEPSALHIYLLADATRQRLEDEINFWNLELAK